jgi:hypothetical protein
MSERSVRRRRHWAGAVALAALTALTGCGIAVRDEPTNLGDGLLAGQDAGAGFGGRFQEPDGPGDVRKPREFVEAYFKAAAGGGPMTERVRAFLTAKASDDWQTEKDEQPTVVRLESVSNAVPAKDGYDVKVQWLQIGTLTPSGMIDTVQRVSGPQEWIFRVVEDRATPGQLRLDGKVPPGLFLSDKALLEPKWYRTNPIYFWDRSNRVLVPDVRYLPLFIEPNQRPTTIVNYLLAGPSSMVERAVEPLPEKAQMDGAVVADEDGLIVGFTAGSISEEQEDIDRLVAQLRWSLAGQKVILQVEKKRRDASGQGADYGLQNTALRTGKLTMGVSDAGDSRGEVVVLTEGASTPAVLRTKANKNVESAAIDRDLERAAFVRRVNGRLQLWLRRGDDEPTEVKGLGTIRTISRPVWVYGARPGCVLVAVNGVLYTVNQSGRPQQNTQLGLASPVTQVATSPEGRRVAFVAGGKAYLSTVDAVGAVNANQTEIGSLSLDRVVSLGWTSEDRLVVFGVSGSTVQAYTLTPDGAAAARLPSLEDASLLTGLTDIATYPGTASDAFNVVARSENGVFEVNPITDFVGQVPQVSLAFFPG